MTKDEIIAILTDESVNLLVPVGTQEERDVFRKLLEDQPPPDVEFMLDMDEDEIRAKIREMIEQIELE